MLRTQLIFCLIFFGLLTGFRSPAAAQEAEIRDLVATNSESQVLLYFSVAHCFTDEIMAGIQNGIPATFTFYVDLYLVRKAWPDREIASHTFSHTITYDNLKEEYHVFLSEKGLETVTPSLKQAQTLMAEVNGLEAAGLEKLTSGRSYRLKVKAKLAKKTMPLNFHYLIPFSSMWDFETDWQLLEFRY